MAIPLAGGGPRAPARQPPPSGPRLAALLAVMPGPGIFYVAARALAGGRA